jgi:GABA(A) receptor-associated protein
MNESKIKNNHFKAKYDFETRKSLYNSLMVNNSNYVPCVVNLAGDIVAKYKIMSPELRVLIQANYTLGQFINILRKRINICSSEGLYVFIDNVLLPTSSVMSKIYSERKNRDGFLYVDLAMLETFG